MSISAAELADALDRILQDVPLVSAGETTLARLITSPEDELVYCFHGAGYEYSYPHAAAEILLRGAPEYNGIYCVILAKGRNFTMPDTCKIFASAPIQIVVCGPAVIGAQDVKPGCIINGAVTEDIVFKKKTRTKAVIVYGRCRKKYKA